MSIARGIVLGQESVDTVAVRLATSEEARVLVQAGQCGLFPGQVLGLPQAMQALVSLQDSELLVRTNNGTVFSFGSARSVSIEVGRTDDGIDVTSFADSVNRYVYGAPLRRRIRLVAEFG